jgi:hypothetical protein
MANEMLFGFVYIPQASRIEDFSPYWVHDRWTEQRMVEDFKIMRAIGSSILRIHITPPVPGATAYDRLFDRRTVPITGEKYLRMYDLMVATARDLGLAIHFDIGSSFSEVSETSLDGWMGRYKGKVESWQFANENWSVFESDQAEGSTTNVDRLERLLKYARRLDPKAQFTADLFPEQIRQIHSRHPALYGNLDILNTHAYYCADYRGWTEPYLRELAAVHTKNAVRPADVPWMPDAVFMQKFSGVADFDKEIWVTEIVASGDGAWSSLVCEAAKADGWRKAVEALSGCGQVTRLYYCWLNDKMHTMEAGITQIGAVRYDGSPSELTRAFKETAEKHAPASSLIHRLSIDLSAPDVSPSDRTVRLGIRLANRGKGALRGRASLELPRGISASLEPFDFELAPGKTLDRTVSLGLDSLPETANHVFLRVEADGQVHCGWAVVRCPHPLVLDQHEAGVPNVSCVPDMAAVQEFLSAHGDDCAIIVGPGTGHWDVECGYRIKIILESIRGRTVPLKTWFMLSEVWDRPLIIVGRPALNYVAQLVELGLPAERHADALAPGHGFVQAIPYPIGSPIGAWGMGMINRLVGFHGCPAALYVAGGDDAGTKAACWDLIRRLWHPPVETVPKATWL